MTKPQIQIGEIVRDMTNNEIAQLKQDELDEQARTQIELDKAEARQNVLNKLGLTTDEAAALLG